MTSYRKISKEVGFVGYLNYPSKEKAEQLLRQINTNPVLKDFKEVLSLYRFLPEAKNQEQLEIIVLLKEAVASGTAQLFNTSHQAATTQFSLVHILPNPLKALRALLSI